jgi:hypothetical protein
VTTVILQGGDLRRFLRAGGCFRETSVENEYLALGEKGQVLGTALIPPGSMGREIIVGEGKLKPDGA